MKSLTTLLILACVATFSVACGDDESYVRPKEAAKAGALFAPDPAIMQVAYRQLGGPGRPEPGCVHAWLHSKETVGLVTRGHLSIFPSDRPIEFLRSVEKGAGVGKWNETWMTAGCP